MNKRTGVPAECSQADTVRWLGAQETPVYLVGGCVRDRVLGQTSSDLDVVVDGNAVHLGRRLADRFDGAFYILDSDRGAARALLPVEGGGTTTVDLTRMYGADIYTDLAARDFTINAMAYPVGLDGTGELIDPHRGRMDLEERRLRVVSHTSLVDDPVRVLRAVRMAHQFGLHPDPSTESLTREAVPLLVSVSPERFRDELCRIMNLSPASVPLMDLDCLGVFGLEIWQPTHKQSSGVECPSTSAGRAFQSSRSIEVICAWEKLLEDGRPPFHSEGEQVRAMFRRAIGHHEEQLHHRLSAVTAGDRTQGLLMKWVMLLLGGGGPDDVEAVLRRFRFSTLEVRRGRTAAHVFGRPSDWLRHGKVSPRQLHRFYREARDCGPESLLLHLADRLAAVGRGETISSPELVAHLVETALKVYYDSYDTIVAPPPLVDGADVMLRTGLAEGPRIGELLDEVRERQVEDTIRTREDALRWLEKHSPRQGDDPST